MKMYALNPGSMTAGKLLGEGETLADLTYAHHGSRHGRIVAVHRVGGGRHHLLFVEGGPAIYVLLPGDTNYPREKNTEEK